MLVVNGAGEIVIGNQQAVSIFGYAHQELIGKSVEDLIPERLRSGHVSHRAGFFTTPRVRPMGTGLELAALRADGSEFPVEISLGPLETEAGTLVTAAIRDISERKRAEAGIRQLNSDLQRRSAELQASNNELESFTYSVSHDLRAPLRHIAGYAQLLTEELPDSLPPEARRHVGHILEGTRQMGQLIDELLDLARIGRQSLKVQVSSLRSVAEEVKAQLSRQAAGREVEWRMGELPYLACDPGLVKQVFANLFSNALKFTGPRERAMVEVGTRHLEKLPVIFVRDNGVGFDMKYAGKLFGIFQRLHRSEDFEGTGVGLATVQRIVHKHGGRIWAESQPDQGATFYFTLGPAQEVACEQPERAEAAP